jgi:hypothetical protein
MPINTTGHPDIDSATGEIAVALRNANPGKPEQTYYDEAMRLRDEIMSGACERARLASRNTARVRHHSADDIDGLGECVNVFAPVVVVVRAGGKRQMEITAHEVPSYTKPGPTIVTIKIPATFTGKCGPNGTGEFYTGVKPGMRGIAMHEVSSTGYESWAFGTGESAWLMCDREDLELHEPQAPEPGDKIMFPRAPMHWNRKNVYVVTAVAGDTMSYVAESAPDAEPYTLTLERGLAMGMTPTTA